MVFNFSKKWSPSQWELPQRSISRTKDRVPREVLHMTRNRTYFVAKHAAEVIALKQNNVPIRSQFTAMLMGKYGKQSRSSFLTQKEYGDTTVLDGYYFTFIKLPSYKPWWGLSSSPRVGVRVRLFQVPGTWGVWFFKSQTSKIKLHLLVSPNL